jgi:ATP-binding cassette subfamily F protein uup
VFDGDEIKEFVGGYDDWQRQRQLTLTLLKIALQRPRRSSAPRLNRSSPGWNLRGRRRLRSRRQELAALPATIEQCESDISRLHVEMAQPQFYQQPREQIAQRQAALKSLEEQLALAYQRWEILEPHGE